MSQKMSDWLIRVLEERDALHTKLMALEVMLTKSKIQPSVPTTSIQLLIPDAQMRLLRKQAKHMRKYLHVLNVRIAYQSAPSDNTE